MNCYTYPFSRLEDLEGAFVVATYLITAPDCRDIMKKAGTFAIGQTIGTWVKVPGISDYMVEKYQGRVLSVQDVSPEREDDKIFCIQIAFPLENFGKSISMLMTALVGNDVSTALEAKLLNLEFVNGGETEFSSPRQGIDNLRRLTGVEGRPIVLNMIKPCAGFTPEEGAELFRQVAAGGVDLIKDDELLGSPDYNAVARRTERYLKVAEEVAAETGKRPVYLPNVSGKPSQVRKNVEAVIGLGAKACLFNFVFSGLDTLMELNEEFGDRIFIMAHYAGVSVMGAARRGIANPVFLGILPRLAGAHAVMTMCPDWGSPAAVFDFQQTVQAQRLAMGTLNPVVTAVGGGITAIDQEQVQRQLGKDTIIGIGGAIQGHPMGATSGAVAAMAAVEATAKGISLEEAASRCKPLQIALEMWQ